jgi:uncharacterized membrane protein (DUF441 family)
MYHPSPSLDVLNSPNRRFLARWWPVPIGIAAVLGLGLPWVAFGCTELSLSIMGFGKLPVTDWVYIHHGIQLCLALLAIALVKKWVPGDYGLHLPHGRSFVGVAIVTGLLIGILMTLVDYAPQLAAGTRPPVAFALTTANVVKWLFFEGVYVGPTEEIPFRALLVPFLAATFPGRVRFGAHEVSLAAIIVAALFALAHVNNFWHRPWPQALGQQVYAFGLGLMYATWLQRSRSILAPIIGHNVGDLTEYGIVFLWVGV